MSNTSKEIYVPVLRGREGELAAYEVLKTELKSQLIPLIEFTSIPYDFVQGRPARTLTEHLDTVFKRFSQTFRGNPAYVDFKWLQSSGHPGAKEIGFKKLQNYSLPIVIPVLSIADTFAPLLKTFPSFHGRAAVRLYLKDFNEDVNLENQLEPLLESIPQAFKMDLILDLQDLGTDLDRATLVARSIFSQIPARDHWNKIIFIASSFPEDLSEVDAETVHTLPRLEWDLWSRLQRKSNLLPRRDIVFGDYAISNPTQKELDPRTMRMSANIRYTSPTSWLIVKGRNVRKYGFDQYFDLSRTLVLRSEYCGRDFSWGDRYISDCAEGQAGPGNATTWRKIGVNHHLTLMVDQLSSELVYV